MTNLFYKQYGTDGPPLLIIHGLFGMLDNWHNIARNLQNDFRIIAIDLRNHGHSPHTKSMTYEEMSEDIALLLNQLQIDKTSLLGHSMGGKVVMHFAMQYPEKTDKIIIADIAPKAYPKGHEIYFEALFKLNKTTISSRAQAESILSETIDENTIVQFLLKSLYRNSDGNFQLRMNVDTIYQFYDEIRSEVKFNWPISNPTLFIKGANSNYIDAKDELHIEDSFTNCQIATIEKAGHWIHADNPTEFIHEVKEFMLQ